MKHDSTSNKLNSKGAAILKISSIAVSLLLTLPTFAQYQQNPYDQIAANSWNNLDEKERKSLEKQQNRLTNQITGQRSSNTHIQELSQERERIAKRLAEIEKHQNTVNRDADTAKRLAAQDSARQQAQHARQDARNLKDNAKQAQDKLSRETLDEIDAKVFKYKQEIASGQAKTPVNSYDAFGAPRYETIDPRQAYDRSEAYRQRLILDAQNKLTKQVPMTLAEDRAQRVDGMTDKSVRSELSAAKKELKEHLAEVKARFDAVEDMSKKLPPEDLAKLTGGSLVLDKTNPSLSYIKISGPNGVQHLRIEDFRKDPIILNRLLDLPDDSYSRYASEFEDILITNPSAAQARANLKQIRSFGRMDAMFSEDTMDFDNRIAKWADESLAVGNTKATKAQSVVKGLGKFFKGAAGKKLIQRLPLVGLVASGASFASGAESSYGESVTDLDLDRNDPSTLSNASKRSIVPKRVGASQ